MHQLKFFFLCALIAGLKGVESHPPFWRTPGETFSAGLSLARVDEDNYDNQARSGGDEDDYDNQARAMPVEEDENDFESRALPFEEPEARLSFDEAQRMDESYMRRRRKNYSNGSSYDQCVSRKLRACLGTRKTSTLVCGTQARRKCKR